MECSDYHSQLAANALAPLAGGAIGRTEGLCPNDAAAAHGIIESQPPPSNGNLYLYYMYKCHPFEMLEYSSENSVY